MCGQSLQPLDCSGILHRQKCPPTLISLQGCATASAFMASLCFSSYTRKVAGEKREKKEALCIMQQILARTYSVGFKKKGKEKYKSVASPIFFQQRAVFLQCLPAGTWCWYFSAFDPKVTEVSAEIPTVFSGLCALLSRSCCFAGKSKCGSCAEALTRQQQRCWWGCKTGWRKTSVFILREMRQNIKNEIKQNFYLPPSPSPCKFIHLNY